jgi:hypothetical protein
MGQFVCANPDCSKDFYSRHSVAKYCSRKCSNFVNKNGINNVPKPRRFSDEELLEMLVSLSEKIGKTPSKNDVKQYLTFTADVYKHFFGSYRNAVVAAGLEPNKPLPLPFSRNNRESIGFGLRFRILKRDNFRCQYCGGTPQEGYILHVDHIVPVSKGGETTEENLITACFVCNEGKSDSM